MEEVLENKVVPAIRANETVLQKNYFSVCEHFLPSLMGENIRRPRKERTNDTRRVVFGELL